jgi:hypothetical protein
MLNKSQDINIYNYKEQMETHLKRYTGLLETKLSIITIKLRNVT